MVPITLNKSTRSHNVGHVGMCVCVCVCVHGIYVFSEDQKNLIWAVSDWLTLVADLYGTIPVGRPLWTQFDDIVFK